MGDPAPYYADETVTLYHGDCREIELPNVDLILTDPPYGDTSIKWDKWPTAWADRMLPLAPSMWCFGSLRMFLRYRDEFANWKLAQDVIWEKHTGSGMHTDRFARIHEHAVQWYQGDWSDIYREPPKVTVGRTNRRAPSPKGRKYSEHLGGTSTEHSVWEDDGTRLQPSIIYAHTMHRRGIHPTQKPIELLDPLLRYACPPGGTVLDPFAGSGSTLLCAAINGRKAIGVEVDERYCESAAQRLAQGILDFGGSA